MWLNVFAIVGAGVILGSLYVGTVLREFGAQPAEDAGPREERRSSTAVELAAGDRTSEREAISHSATPPLH